MFDEPRQLIEFIWVLATPVLGQHADGALVLLGIGLAMLFTAAIAVVLAYLHVLRPVPSCVGGARGRARRRSRSHPPATSWPHFTARPRAPGAVLA